MPTLLVVEFSYCHVESDMVVIRHSPLRERRVHLAEVDRFDVEVINEDQSLAAGRADGSIERLVLFLKDGGAIRVPGIHGDPARDAEELNNQLPRSR
jgi:hypothetical protein